MLPRWLRLLGELVQRTQGKQAERGSRGAPSIKELAEEPPPLPRHRRVGTDEGPMLLSTITCHERRPQGHEKDKREEDKER